MGLMETAQKAGGVELGLLAVLDWAVMMAAPPGGLG